MWDHLVEHPAYEYRINWVNVVQHHLYEYPVNPFKSGSTATSMEHVCLLHVMNKLYPNATNGYIIAINIAAKQQISRIHKLLEKIGRKPMQHRMEMYHESRAQWREGVGYSIEEYEKQVEKEPEGLVQNLFWLEWN